MDRSIRWQPSQKPCSLLAPAVPWPHPEQRWKAAVPWLLSVASASTWCKNSWHNRVSTKLDHGRKPIVLSVSAWITTDLPSSWKFFSLPLKPCIVISSADIEELKYLITMLIKWNTALGIWKCMLYGKRQSSLEIFAKHCKLYSPLGELLTINTINLPKTPSAFQSSVCKLGHEAHFIFIIYLE